MDIPDDFPDDGLRAAWVALRSEAAKKAGYPTGAIHRRQMTPEKLARVGDFGNKWALSGHSAWDKRLEAAGTGRRCNMCKCVRMFFDGEQEEGDHWRWDANGKPRIKWAFIPEGRKLCVECSDKQQAKRAADRLAKASGEASSKASKPNQVSLLQQLVQLTQEQAERARKREEDLAEQARKREEDLDERLLGLTHQMAELVQTNMEIAEENKALREEVQKLTFEVQTITVELESLNNTQDRVKTALETKAGVSFEEEEIFDAEKHDDTYQWDEGPGKFLDDDYDSD